MSTVIPKSVSLQIALLFNSGDVTRIFPGFRSPWTNLCYESVIMAFEICPSTIRAYSVVANGLSLD